MFNYVKVLIFMAVLCRLIGKVVWFVEFDCRLCSSFILMLFCYYNDVIGMLFESVILLLFYSHYKVVVKSQALVDVSSKAAEEA